MVFLAFGKFKFDPLRPSLPMYDEKVNFAGKAASELLNISPENSNAWAFSSDRPMRDVVEAFGKGVHRALVTVPARNGQPQRTEILTQTDVVRWIGGHAAFLKCLDVTIAELNLTGQPIQHILDTDTPLEGFRKASQLELSCIAVVDDRGRLVGNLSASDLRGVDASDVRWLAKQSVRAFLHEHSPGSLNPQTVSPSTPLRHAIQRLLQKRLHRLWIVNSEGRPMGVCSMSDICFRVAMAGAGQAAGSRQPNTLA
jgi:CBS-domain-containing membrane protein